ncbi:hypothetical protein EJ04DRAFT_595134 [Polyplosphaeria fusca]|uniref:Tyr recombinase domain-containing protein n=1 Tax=Polyplosphaeria fusca TaxID=682080 RepID=A0A9P4V621_9PLEO|nr:hypothetical protein EJ04DRAFT_595134 [Polyplosphaeria fusca]
MSDSDYDSDIALELDGNAAISGSRPKAYEVTSFRRTRAQWTRFAKNSRVLQREKMFDPPPTIQQIQAFLRWKLRKGRGLLDEKPTIWSLKKEFHQLERLIRSEQNYNYSAAERKEVYQYLSKLPETDSTSTRKRTKPVGLYTDVADLIYFCLCCDEYEWRHPREMIQVLWILELMAYWGLRPGEIIESCIHPGSYEGIAYEDCSLYLIRTEDNTLQFELKISLRYRKFKRKNEGLSEMITLYEETDPGNIFACPVRKFIALALTDEAFKGPKIPSDFSMSHRSIPPTATSTLYQIQADKYKTPVLRRIVQNGKSIYPSRILTASMLFEHLRKLGQRCGYQQNISAYAFQRGFANKIKGKVAASRVRQLIGHANDGTLQSYLSTDIAIDTQNAVQGLP